MKIVFKGLVKSHKKDKKWDAIFIVDGKEKIVPFGAKGYRDFTLLRKRTDLEKQVAQYVRQNYIQRHSRMGEDWNDPLTPGALSRWLLWEEPTLELAEKQFRKRFGL
jgi:hypothetical protein